MRRYLHKLLFGAIFPVVTIQKTVWGCQDGLATNEFPSPNLKSSVNVVTIGQDVSLFCSNKNTSLSIKYLLFLGKNCLKTEVIEGKPMVFNLTISSAKDVGPYKCKAQVSNCSKYSQPFNFTIVEEKSLPSSLLPLLLPSLLLGLLLIILILVFLTRPKCKARKFLTGITLRENEPRDSGDEPVESPLYADLCENQAGITLRENEPRDSGDEFVESQLYANLCENQAGTGQVQEVHYTTPVFKEVASKQQEACHDNKTGSVYSELAY